MLFHKLLRIAGRSLTIFMLVVVLTITVNFCVSSAVASMASDTAKCVGYSVSGQKGAAGSITGVDCTAVQNKLPGMIDKGFFLSGMYIKHFTVNKGNGVVRGLFIHEDRFERKVFSNFAIDFTGTKPVKVTDLSIQVVSNLKPKIKTYLVPSEKVSLKDLQNIEFTRALELVSLHARQLDGDTGADSGPEDYLAVAFQMDKEVSGSRIKLVVGSKSGSMKGKEIGQTISKDGWLFVAAPTRVACDNGREMFFNVIQERQDKSRKQVLGVFSSYSLERRVQMMLAERGYKPGPVDGKSGRKTRRAIKAFQKDMGLRSDGKASPTLLRLLISSELSPAPLSVQQQLSYIGYDVGTINGKLGSKTRKAIRAFQKDNGMTENGQIDAALFCKVSDVAIQASLLRNNFEVSTFKPAAVAVKRENRFENRMWLNQAAK